MATARAAALLTPATFVPISPPVPAPPTLAFGVWNGVSIGRRYGSLGDIAEAIGDLAPSVGWRFEWLVKAGEAGTWQATWDSHPMAVSGPEKLADLIAQGREFGLEVVPYVIVRGRPSWRTAEWVQIAECAAVASRTVLNLEPGDHYWDGPTQVGQLDQDYLQPLRQRIDARAPGAPLELCAIPRERVINELGGRATIRAWLRAAQSASWECYDAASPHRDGETYECLDVAHSMQRVENWLPEELRRSEYRIPLVQRSRIHAWSDTEYAAAGLQVWHLDGD